MFQKQAIKTSQKNRIKFLLCSVKNVNSFKSDIVKPFGTHLLGQSLLKKDKIEITSQCRLIVYLKSTDSLLLNNLYWIALDNNSEILQNQNLFYHRNTKNLLLWHSILTPLKLLVHPSRLWKPFGVFFCFGFWLVFNTLETLLIHKSNTPLLYCTITFQALFTKSLPSANIYAQDDDILFQEYVHSGPGNSLPGNILRIWMLLLNCCRSVTFLVPEYLFQLKWIWNWMKIPVERIFCVLFFSFSLVSTFHLHCILVIYGSPFTKSGPHVTVKAATLFLIFSRFFSMFSYMQQIKKSKFGLRFNSYFLHHQ